MCVSIFFHFYWLSRLSLISIDLSSSTIKKNYSACCIRGCHEKNIYMSKKLVPYLYVNSLAKFQGKSSLLHTISHILAPDNFIGRWSNTCHNGQNRGKEMCNKTKERFFIAKNDVASTMLYIYIASLLHRRGHSLGSSCNLSPPRTSAEAKGTSLAPCSKDQLESTWRSLKSQSTNFMWRQFVREEDCVMSPK